MFPFILRYQNATYFDHEMMVAKSPSPLPSLPAHHQAEVSCTLFTFIESTGLADETESSAMCYHKTVSGHDWY